MSLKWTELSLFCWHHSVETLTSEEFSNSISWVLEVLSQASGMPWKTGMRLYVFVIDLISIQWLVTNHMHHTSSPTPPMRSYWSLIREGRCCRNLKKYFFRDLSVAVCCNQCKNEIGIRQCPVFNHISETALKMVCPLRSWIFQHEMHPWSSLVPRQ